MARDVLSDVLATLELSSEPWFRAELHHPFGVAVPPAADGGGTIRFHVATENACTIAVADRAPVRFRAGDLVLVSGGAAHVLSDAPGRESVPLAEVLGGGFAGIGPVELGDGPDRTVVVCGEFRFGESALHPFVGSLPPLLHVPGDGATSFEWIEQVLRHIEREARIRPTGHVEVIRRLAEILLIEVLRTRLDDGEIGALSALADPQLGRALQAIHDHPETTWKLEQLARIAGQSRTLFAERFRERMGLSPMKYLTAWRMQKARRLLASGNDPVGVVARRVGYVSDSAFNRSFREHFGSPPGAWRRGDDADGRARSVNGGAGRPS